MTVLYINHEKNLGGAARSLLGLIDEMIPKVNILVLTPYKQGKFIEELKKRNIEYIAVRYFMCISYNKYNGAFELLMRVLGCILAYSYNFFVAMILSLKLKNRGIDIIHSNSSVINIGLFLARFMNVRYVQHIREFIEEDFGWVPLPNRKMFEKNIDRHSDAIIFISQILMGKYKNKFDLHKCECIYNGVDGVRHQKTYNKNSNNFLMASRIVPGKGHSTAIHAVDYLVKKLGVKNFRIVFMGGGDQEYIKELKEEVIKLGIDKYIIFYGYCDDMEMARTNYKYELVCSQCEAFGRVVIEAMLAENIVIASNSGAIPELIVDKKNGYLYEKNNFEQLAFIMKQCVQNSDDQNIREYAFNYAKNNFNRKKNAMLIYDLYNNILKNITEG